MAAFSHASLEGGMQFSSADFEGRKYLLSAPHPLTDITDFQQHCKDVDGYLAEIDTQAEYDFIMEFLSQNVPGGRETALVGGSDQTTEGQWVGMTSQAPMTFFSWYSDYGTRGTGKDCMYLVWNSRDQGMHDWKCQDTKLRRFVCEVPEGQWAAWGSWSSCSVTCGGNGVRHRSRHCDNSLPTSGVCHGDTADQGLCNEGSCDAYCYTGDGASYVGTISRTKYGKTCQAWSSQSPHRHTLVAADFPSGRFPNNYCRNPDGEPGPWCYTTDSGARWQLCDVSRCG